MRLAQPTVYAEAPYGLVRSTGIQDRRRRVVVPRVATADEDLPWRMQMRRICAVAMPAPATLRRYHMTVDDFRRRLIDQEGGCAICRATNFRLAVVPLHVDHDHICCGIRGRSCGRCVRGLLCSNCNGGLGWLELKGSRAFKPNRWLIAAMSYLARWGCWVDDPKRLAEHRAQSDARPGTRVVEKDPVRLGRPDEDEVQ